jgi:hypothetical protein
VFPMVLRCSCFPLLLLILIISHFPERHFALRCLTSVSCLFFFPLNFSLTRGLLVSRTCSVDFIDFSISVRHGKRPRVMTGETRALIS